MPRSNAAVLTSISTPSGLESCAILGSTGGSEAFCFEGDEGALDDLDSNAIQNLGETRTPLQQGPEILSHLKATTAQGEVQTCVGDHRSCGLQGGRKFWITFVIIGSELESVTMSNEQWAMSNELVSGEAGQSDCRIILTWKC